MEKNPAQNPQSETTVIGIPQFGQNSGQTPHIVNIFNKPPAQQELLIQVPQISIFANNIANQFTFQSPHQFAFANNSAQGIQQNSQSKPLPGNLPNLEGLDSEEDQKPIEESKTSTQPSTDSTQPNTQKPSIKKALSQMIFQSQEDTTQLDVEMILNLQSNFSQTQFSRFLEENKRLQLQIKELFTRLQDEQLQKKVYQDFIRNNFKSYELACQKSDKQTQEALKNCFFNKPLVVLSFASPLVRYHQDEIIRMNLIDYQKEFEGVRSALSKTGNAIQIKQVFATQERFDQVMTECPMGLHFSGHGIEIQGSNSAKKDTHQLVFEKIDGQAHFILPRMLTVPKSLKFVFFATCHSEAAGEIFQNAGVQHVICILKSREILDEAAVYFSRNFYELLFKGKLSICKAFVTAKEMISHHEKDSIKSEDYKFIILRNHTECECEILGPYPTGGIEELQPKPKFKFEFAKLEDFVGRQEDMHKILSCVQNNRLTTVRGVPGIGKTTVSKGLGFYISERDIFKDGVIYISMRGKHQTSFLIEALYEYFKRVQAFETLNIQELAKIQAEQELMQNKIFQVLEDKESLLIIDNLEEVLNKDETVLKEFLKSLLERLNHLKILTTSRELIGNLEEITEKVYNLDLLNCQYSFELLQQKSRQFSDEEKNQLVRTVSEKMGAIAQPWRKVDNFFDHPLFNMLAGHPYTITLVASWLQDSAKTLSVIYQELSKMYGIQDIEGKNIINPINALRNSIQASVEQVRNFDHRAIQLFCLIGLLPSGITADDLNELWEKKYQKSSEWYSLAETLKKYSLLIQKVENTSEITKQQQKYILLPFMCTAAENLLSKFELEQNQGHLVNFFQNRLMRLFTGLTVEVKRDQQSLYKEILLEYETNIWSSIYRICEMNRYRTKETSLDAEKKKIHAHLLDGGYSSTDDYDRQLVFRFEEKPSTDNLQSVFMQKSQLTVRSIGVENQSDKSQDQTAAAVFITEEQQPINRESTTNDETVINEQQNKRVRFNEKIESTEFHEPKKHPKSEYGSRLTKKQLQTRRQTIFGAVSEENDNLANDLNPEELDHIYHSESEGSMQNQPSGFSSARGSIPQSAENDLEAISEDSQIKNSKTERSSASSDKSDQVQDSIQNVDQNSDIDNLQSQFMPPKQQILAQKSDTNSVTNGSGSNSQGDSISSKFDSVITKTSAPAPDSRELLRLSRFQNLRPSTWQKNTESTSQKLALEPIQEQRLELTNYGLFLIVCASVFIMCDKLKDALRLIELAKETRFPDLLCQANLLKLIGLIYFRQKQYKEAFEQIEKAQKQFLKFSVKGNLGFAHCLVVKSFILYTKLSDFSQEFLKSKGFKDDNKLFKDQQQNFRQAKQIYQEVGHLAGEYYCSQQLCQITKKLKENYKDILDESKMLGTKLQQLPKKSWIERYTGQEVSLLLEIIDKKELGQIQSSQSKPNSNGKWGLPKEDKKQNQQQLHKPRDFSKNHEPMQQTNTFLSDQKKKPEKIADILSSDDEFFLQQADQRPDSRRQSVILSNKATLNLEAIPEHIPQQQRKRAEVKHSQQKELFNPQDYGKIAPATSKSFASNELKRSKNFQAKIILPESEKQQTHQAIGQIHYYKPKEEKFSNKQSVEFTWAIRIQGDVWEDLDYIINCQVEDFYQMILQNAERRRDVFQFKRNQGKLGVVQYRFMLNQTQKRLLNGPKNTTMCCKNMTTSELLQVARFDKICNNTYFTYRSRLQEIFLTHNVHHLETITRYCEKNNLKGPIHVADLSDSQTKELLDLIQNRQGDQRDEYDAFDIEEPRLSTLKENMLFSQSSIAAPNRLELMDVIEDKENEDISFDGVVYDDASYLGNSETPQLERKQSVERIMTTLSSAGKSIYDHVTQYTGKLYDKLTSNNQEEGDPQILKQLESQIPQLGSRGPQQQKIPMDTSTSLKLGTQNAFQDTVQFISKIPQVFNNFNKQKQNPVEEEKQSVQPQSHTRQEIKQYVDADSEALKVKKKATTNYSNVQSKVKDQMQGSIKSQELPRSSVVKGQQKAIKLPVAEEQKQKKN